MPRETLPGEARVAATPATVTRLVGLGYEVVVETVAGAASSFSDDAYTDSGARVGRRHAAWAAEIVLHVNPLGRGGRAAA